MCGGEKDEMSILWFQQRDYQIERVHRALLFDFDGEPIGGSEDVTDYAGRRKQCIDCDKILPRKLFEEMME